MPAIKETMTLTDQDLSALEALDKSATAGPWMSRPFDESQLPMMSEHPDNPMVCIVGIGVNRIHGHENAALIAAMRNVLPALIAEVRASREALREIYLECEGDVDGAPDRSRLSGLCNVICRLVPESIAEEAMRKAKGD